MFQDSALAAMKSHALSEYPRESCGFVVNGDYVPLINRAANPEAEFKIGEEDYIRNHEGLQAVVHSHPNGPYYPSAADMRGQVDTDVPWAIIATDGERASDPVVWGDPARRPALIGREFLHGVTDCYSLCRDYYALEHGIAIPEFPRDDNWWNSGGNLYLDHFAEAGFFEIDRAELRPGDAVLMSVLASVPNHAGVAVADGLLLHHLPKRLSRREPLGPWARQITHCLRHRELADA